MNQETQKRLDCLVKELERLANSKYESIIHNENEQLNTIIVLITQQNAVLVSIFREICDIKEVIKNDK